MSLSQSFGRKCIHCHCQSPLAQSVPTVIVTVLWWKVYPSSLSESFGTKCTYCRCHSSLAQSAPTLIVTVFCHKVYLPSLSDSCGIKVVRFFLILPRFFGAWPLFYIFPRLFGVWPFFCNSITSLWSVVLFFYILRRQHQSPLVKRCV